MAIDWDARVLGPTLEVFGEPATVLPASGGAFEVTGVFDAAYRDVQVLDPLEANAVSPVLGLRLSQCPVMPQQNDRVRVPSVGRAYLVVDVRPDGHGWAKLLLGDTGAP